MEGNNGKELDDSRQSNIYPEIIKKFLCAKAKKLTLICVLTKCRVK